MTQNDKEILLKDLSTRLPYGVKVRTPYNDAILRGIVDRKGVKTTIDYTDIVTDKQTYPIRYIKPYLRPMSSMTAEELYKVQEILGKGVEIRNGFISIIDSSINSFTYLELQAVFEWFNTYHFDYRGLIEKGLAIKVTEDNNPYKE